MRRWLIVAAVLLLTSGVVVAQLDPQWVWRWSMGDLDHDGDVDIYDFSVLSGNYGKPESQWVNIRLGTPRPPQQRSKGVAATGCSGCASVDYAALLRDLGVTHLYNWGVGGDWQAMQDAGATYVPMLRRREPYYDPIPQSRLEDFTAFWGTGRYWLVGSEPNLNNPPDSDSLAPADAVALYTGFMDRIFAVDPDAKIIMGGVLHERGGGHLAWLDEFWALLPQEYRDRIYGWHGHFYLFRCSLTGREPWACWQDNITGFVDWCHAHNGTECWDTEGPELPGNTPDEWFGAFLNANPDPWAGTCEGQTCYDWWRSKFDVTMWWSLYKYGGYAGALVNNDGTLTQVGRWFAEK